MSVASAPAWANADEEPPPPVLTGGVAGWEERRKAAGGEQDDDLEGAEDDLEGAEDDLEGAVDDTAGEDDLEGAVDDTEGGATGSGATGGTGGDIGGDTAGDAKPGFQGLRGTVTDAASGDELIEATIKVVKGPIAKASGLTVLTDIDGSFELPLEWPGEYELRVYTALYKGQRIQVTIEKGQSEEIDVKLEPEEGATEEVVVEAKIEKKTEAAQLQIRKKATTVSDVLSAQEISKTPDSSAGDAVKRVVSVTIVDGKYVVLRGLEGRYVTTLLNGVILPSPEPDRNAVPLDLFPANLLSNLTVIKSYGVEYPAQFGGGTLLIETNSYPEDLEIKLGVSTSANTATQFADNGLGNVQQTGAGGFFGFDNGSRQLPSAVPRDEAVRGLDDGRTEEIGESFENVWTPTANDALSPNLSLSATLGDTVRPGGKKFGYLASGTFRRGLGTRATDLGRLQITGGELTVADSLTNVTTEVEATIGALVNAGYDIDQDNSISVFGLYTHVGEDTSSHVEGFTVRDDGEIVTERLQFVERALSFGQILGSHRVPEASNLEIRWQGNVASTFRDELDSRDITFERVDRDDEGNITGGRYKDQPGSGQRFFSRLDDFSVGAGLDASLTPHPRVKVRAGTMIQSNSRDLESRRFRYQFVGMSNAERMYQPVEDMLDADAIGPSFELNEQTLQEDTYTAGLLVSGFYGGTEIGITDALRGIVGLRYERSTQTLQNGSPYAIAGNVNDLKTSYGDLLPAANLVYALTPEMNLRAAYSKTLVRPRFRELAPFLYFDFIRRRSISGNPDLEVTDIHNVDLRWEWFFGETDVVAASLFYKQFDNPIEQVVVNVGNDSSFRNADSADMAGVELEFRAGLGRFARALDPLKVGANLGLIYSQIELPADAMLLTSQARPLYGQSPFVVNLSAEYSDRTLGDVGLLYNVAGRRIVDVGIQGLPDIYEQPFHRLDLVVSRRLGDDLKLKASISNVLNDRIELRQGDIEVTGYDPGVAFSLGLDWVP